MPEGKPNRRVPIRTLRLLRLRGKVKLASHLQMSRGRGDCTEGKPYEDTTVPKLRWKMLTGGLVLWRNRLFLGVEIEFRETPFVRQHKGFRGIVAIDINGFGGLVSDTDSVMILRPRDRDLGRH